LLKNQSLERGEKMAKKSFVILLCLLFLFTWTVIPDAFARERRGGPDNAEIWAPAIFFGTIAIVFLIMHLLSSSSQDKTPKKQDKNDTKTELYKDVNKNLNISQLNESDSVTEQESVEQQTIDDATSLSFRF
jgi:hypothetical protein